MPKQYRATFLLGHSSETDDVEGAVTEIRGAPQPARELLDDRLPLFLGEIEQVPPAHSAVKVGGRRAYKLARAGRTVELSPRPVSIHRLTVLRYDYPELELDIECGSGTYIRSLGRDLAAALGTSCVMSALERTAIGEFRVEHASTPEEITADGLERHMQPALAAVSGLPRVTVPDAQRIELHHGRPIEAPPRAAELLQGPHTSQEWAAITPDGQLTAILRERQLGKLWPAHNFDID
jgi:tRNA pseudouridine55 synthase